MDELLFDLRKQNDWIKERFANKDLITLEDLLADYEDLIFENEELNNQIKDLEQDIQDNYKPISKSEQYE